MICFDKNRSLYSEISILLEFRVIHFMAQNDICFGEILLITCLKERRGISSKASETIRDDFIELPRSLCHRDIVSDFIHDAEHLLLHLVFELQVRKLLF